MGNSSLRCAALGALVISCGGSQHGGGGGTEPEPRVVTYGPLQLKTDAKTSGLAVFLGTDEHDGSTVWPLPNANAKANVDAMYVLMGGPEGATGGLSPVKLSVAPNPDKSVQVGTFEEFAGGVGDQWKAGVWLAAIVATTVLGKDLTDFTFSASSGGYIDGPSASGLMTGGFLAALTGMPVDPTVTMTGIINPDGTIGPVGGIPEKFLGSIEKGKKRLGYPIGMRMARSEATGEDVDLVELAKKHGAEAVEIADVREAYKLLTHKSLPDTVPVADADMALDAGTSAALEVKYKAWSQQLATQWAPIVQLDSAGKLPSTLRDLHDRAKENADAAEALHKKGLAGAAYERLRIATMYASATNAVLGVVAKVRDGQIREALDMIAALDSSASGEQATFEQIGLMKPSTLGGHLLMMSAFKAAIMGWTDHKIASQAFLQANETLSELSNVPPEQLASPAIAEQVALAVKPAVLPLEAAIAESKLALDELDFEKEDSVMYMCSIPNVHRMATSFQSAAAAGLNYFDQLIVEPMAKQYGMDLDQGRNRFAAYEPPYLAGIVAARLPDSDGLPSDLKTKWGEKSLAWGLFTLAGSQLAFFNASSLIAKYYSLGIHLDENNKVDHLQYEEAFTNMLASAERNARANARAAKIAAGAIPIQARIAYQIAMVERAGTLDDKIDALSQFWASSAFSQSAVMLARN